MRIVWHGRKDSDWFEVWVGETRIFMGHPQDFWYEFTWYAKKYGLLDVTEEVRPS